MDSKKKSMLLEVKATEFSKVSLTLIACYFLIIAASQLMSQKLKTTYKASTSKVTDKNVHFFKAFSGILD